MGDRRKENCGESGLSGFRGRSDMGILRRILVALYDRDDCGDLAKRLTERFGGVSGIFSATKEELMQVKGVTPRVATFFTVMRPLQRQALLRLGADMSIDCERAAVEYAAVYFMNEYNPLDVCVCLDKSGRVIGAERVTIGERLREIASAVCKRNADLVLLMRYDRRLRRDETPSAARRRFLTEALDLFVPLEVGLVDYIEYAPYRFFSLGRAIDGDSEFRSTEQAREEKIDPIDPERAREYFAACDARAEERQRREAEEKEKAKTRGRDRKKDSPKE